MGTNIYIRRKTPRMVPEYDEVHVCKLSYGWRAHFDGSSALEPSWTNSKIPRVGNMDDLRDYLDTGEWELIDECGDSITLDEVLAHDDFVRDGKKQNTQESINNYHYYDREGYPWSWREFR